MAKKFGRRALAVLLVYLVLGALLPYVRHREAESPLPASEAWQDERVLYVKTNEEALTWRLRLIESAREELILSTFDFRADEAGGDILAALGAAADRGVRVRILVDGGNGQLYFEREPEVRALAARENVQIRLYNPFDLLRPWSFNPRLHDKYLLADGKAYLLGGRNTNDLFLGEMGPGSSEDRDLLIWREAGGGTPQALGDYFEEIWALPCNRAVTGKAAPGLLEERYQTLRQRRPEDFEEVNWRESTLETRGVALISGSPLPENKPPLVWKQLCDRMEQGQDVLIQTPYIICGGEMYRDLESLSDGRRVTIATNAVESGLNPWGCADFLNQKGRILKTGVTVRALAGDHSVHTKSILIDDDISIVGSYNLDMRSTYLDTETMVAVDCPALNRQLREEAEALPSRTFHPDGAVTESPDCPEPGLPLGKRLVYGLLQLITPPFRFLL